MFDFLRRKKQSTSLAPTRSTALEHEYRESLSNLRQWATPHPGPIGTCFAIVASPNGFARLWSGYQRQIPTTEEDRTGREMAKRMGILFDDETPDLLIGNVYDVLRNRDNRRLPTNEQQWLDATVEEYRRNARESGMI